MRLDAGSLGSALGVYAHSWSNDRRKGVALCDGGQSEHRRRSLATPRPFPQQSTQRVLTNALLLADVQRPHIVVPCLRHSTPIYSLLNGSIRSGTEDMRRSRYGTIEIEVDNGQRMVETAKHKLMQL